VFKVVKHIAEAFVEVVLRHFHRCRYRSSTAVVLLLEGLRSHKVFGYQGIRWTRRFTWFGPPERNALRPRVKGVVLLCLSAQLRSSLFSLSVRVCGVRPLQLSSARTFYSPRSGSYKETPELAWAMRFTPRLTTRRGV
jgi:hypothetical protein